MHPAGVFVAEALDIAAGKDPGGQIPVVTLAVNNDFSRRRQHGYAVILRFGCARKTAKQRERDEEEEQEW